MWRKFAGLRDRNYCFLLHKLASSVQKRPNICKQTVGVLLVENSKRRKNCSFFFEGKHGMIIIARFFDILLSVGYVLLFSFEILRNMAFILDYCTGS